MIMRNIIFGIIVFLGLLSAVAVGLIVIRWSINNTHVVAK